MTSRTIARRVSTVLQHRTGKLSSARLLLAKRGWTAVAKAETTIATAVAAALMHLATWTRKQGVSLTRVQTSALQSPTLSSLRSWLVDGVKKGAKTNCLATLKRQIDQLQPVR